MTRKVHLFVPCMASSFAPGIGLASADCLSAAGCAPVFEPRATCCGQMFLNSGRTADAAGVARRFVRAFRDAEVVVSPSWSCVQTVREQYGELLSGPDLAAWEDLRERTFELCDFLASACGATRWTGSLAARAVLHRSCHMPRDERVLAGLEAMLSGVDGLALGARPADECCGFGGVFWTLWRDVSAAIGRRRAGVLAAGDPDLIILAEPGCLLQVRGAAAASGFRGRVLHVAEVLALAIGRDRTGPAALPAPAPAPVPVPVPVPDPEPAPAPRGIRASAALAVRDQPLRAAVLKATDHALRTRAAALADLASPEAARDAATDARLRAVHDLPALVDRLAARLADRGVTVHRATTAADACAIATRVARAAGAGLVVKSKSMLGEEIGLVPALESAGCRVVETDLGEYIVQLRGEPPSHITAPALHLSRGDVADLFAGRLGMTRSDEPADLAAFARGHLRGEFLAADVGIVGVNLAVAATGDLVTLTNEGNGRLCETLPRTLLAIAGIEKVVATAADAASLLRVIARNATGQASTVYTSLLRGPAAPGEPAGPAAVHVVLVDAGRTRMAADPDLSAILRCVRCGACMNACPVYRTIGGHAYESVYPGPMGIAWTCGLRGLAEGAEATYACTLCGECGRVCPVGIDLPCLIRTLRTRAPKPLSRRLALRAGRSVVAGPRRMALFERAGSLAARRLPALFRAVARSAGWTTGDEPAPAPAAVPFRRAWKTWEPLRPFPQPTADVPAQHPVPVPVPVPTPVPVPVPEPVPAPAPSLLDAFLARFRALSGEVLPLRDLLADPARAGCAPGSLVLCDRRAASLGLAASLAASGLDVRDACDAALTPADAARAATGFTGCAALVAETGAALLDHGRGEDRLASLLPPVHVLVATPDQVVATLDDALALRDAAGSPSAVLVAGPSRTADIEKRLVLGMHGPGRVVLVLAEAPPDAPAPAE